MTGGYLFELYGYCSLRRVCVSLSESYIIDFSLLNKTVVFRIRCPQVLYVKQLDSFCCKKI